MSRETSLYLDLMRILAAVSVFLNHLKRDSITGGFLKPLGVYGTEGVVLFFVISGVVIAHVAATREGGARSYGIARLARLWSVVVPAVLLTIALDLIGSRLAPALYAEPALPPLWGLDLASLGRAVATLLFVNQFGPWNVSPGTNGPFWSLSFEFWYYAAFAALCYARGWTRIGLVALFVAAVGGPILTLWPMWLLGVAVHHLIRGGGRGGPVDGALWLGSGLVMAVLLALKYKVIYGLAKFIDVAQADLAEKYALALLFSLHLYAFSRIGHAWSALPRSASTVIRAVAGRSFSLYLYQAPLLFFFGALTAEMTSRGWRIAIIILGTLSSVALLAQVTELRKRVLAGWLSAVAPAAPARAA